ncbi:glycosyltransferase 87 family protein [Paenarthrobacter sp. Z7-10]|uniref:glycosyltransferase 87 family protein n=1 Tax=Paenarthrobacter sp. Z7-10 TaxID=2787635 RepID=UPI0022A98446|nr:glycosyltransferase family 87 protein [Paenarthrobacter sp. Z7-10]
MSTDSFFGNLTRLRNRVLPAKAQARLNTPRGLLWGFVAVHLFFVLFMMIWVLQGQAFSDTNIYRDWALGGFREENLVGLPSPWVYPILALLPIAIAGLAGPGPFLLIWVLMITALNAVAVGKLTAWGRNAAAIKAAWWWMGFVFLMGWLGFARVDGLTAPIVLIALAYGVSHPFVASLLLSAATWVKVWPAAVVLSLLTVVKQRVRVIAAGVLVTAVVTIAAFALGVAPKLLNFLTAQGDRGMQLEATFTTPWLWLSVLHIDGSRMYMNTDINSMQVDGPGTEVMSFLMQPLLILAALVVVVLIFWALHNGKRNGGTDRTELLLAGSLTMVTAFVVFNKVGSPQFMVWLAPAVAVGLAHSWKEWRVPATMLIGIALATFFVDPLFYDALSHNNPVMALVLTIRNVLLVVLFCWCVRRLYLLGRRSPSAISLAKES